MDWEIVIGLETHVQLNACSKIFSGSSTRFGALPNTQANIVDLALPGSLPVMNHAAAEQAIRFGLAVGGHIAPCSVFARKNYFYPDLPKGYQISQHDQPIVTGGVLHFLVGENPHAVPLTRAHLEEDAGKSMHDAFNSPYEAPTSRIDLNRAGTPLLEIVSEPAMRSAAEAVAYARALHSLVMWLGICDGNMQEGSFRCDANISVRPQGQTTLGTRAEIKNLNSFRFLERALLYEARRQITRIEAGETIVQETRLYDAQRDQTRSMRSKENAPDYRYFPDPDLPPLHIAADWIEAVRATLPELPEARRARFESVYGLSAYDAAQLTTSRDIADYFEAVLQALPRDQTKNLSRDQDHPLSQNLAYSLSQTQASPLPENQAKPFSQNQANALPQNPARPLIQDQAKLAANWIMGELAAALNRADITIKQSPIAASTLATLITRVLQSTISNKIAREVFSAMWEGEQGGQPDAIIEARGLKQINDHTAVAAIIDGVLATHTTMVAEYRSGKQKAFNALVGQVMKATKGQANPQQVNELIKEKLA